MGKKKLYNSAQGYDLFASMYDESLLHLNSFERGSLEKLLGDLKGKRVLDIGCGTGRIIQMLREHGAEIVAFDISEEMLGIVNRKFPNIECVVGDSDNLPFEDESFDLVLGLFWIVHLRDLRASFDEVYRVLKKGGRFILSNINQRKAPKLTTKSGENIVIESYYHMPQKVVEALEYSYFDVARDEFIYEKEVWVNQIIEARK
ncbi:MAG: methyltransferase domain-containing protein [Nitrospirae bacterium]|nr:methyltransferase domain-containing protein [Nitrospirota bacterium]